jgi:hypothetical protein
MNILERFPLAYCETRKCHRPYSVVTVEPIGAETAYADLLCDHCKSIIATISPGVPTGVEVQSGVDRLKFAEQLMSKNIPPGHEGRDTWLLNYGRGPEARAMRREQGIGFDEDTQAAPIIE